VSDEHPKNMEDMKKFAEELNSRMKSLGDADLVDGKSEYDGGLLEDASEDHTAADHDKAKCPFCTVPKEREQLLRTLEGDIDALGWDQNAKMWGVLIDENSGEEYLKLMRELPGYAPDEIMKIAKRGRAKENVKGIVVAVEAWSYPDDVMTLLKDDPESFHALYNLLPPSDHPERTERRAVSMYNRDGTYACVSRARGGQPELMPAVDPAMAPAIAALLGMVPRAKKLSKKRRRAAFRAAFKQIKTMAEIISFVEQVHEEMEDVMEKEGITQQQYLRRMFDQMPDDVRDDLISTMPDDLKKMLGYDT
jgi:hypothetical protein